MNRIDTTAAARLLRYAATPTARPTSGSDYRMLLDRYRTDTEFADGVVAIAEGSACTCTLSARSASSSPVTATDHFA
jgi:hypothetical protein